MSELDDAIARLDRAVARLEAAPGLTRPDPAPELARLAREHAAAGERVARERAAEGERVEQLTSAIVTRVEAALDKIGKALKEE
jgi:hypothetical protein